VSHVEARSVTATELGLRGERALAIVGPLPARPRLAVVGSRAAHRRQRQAVPWIVQEAAAQGWSIVSGGALGIDGDAHRAALAADVPQVAVLPCGPDRPYPPDHVGLFDAMVRSGSAILFSQPVGTAPSRAMFASRNALVVGLADAIIVVEAAARSGSILTGRLALRKLAMVGAVVGTRGTAMLVAMGARPIAIDDEDSARAPVRGLLLGQPAEETDAWPPHLCALRDVLRASGPRGANVGMLGMVALAEAEALGLVAEVVPGRWVAVR
jgi:DNA protecting protein DprA